MSSTASPVHKIFVIPCSAAKGAQAAPASELYTSANFAHMLRAAQIEAADTARVLSVTCKVMILSALHGLVDLDTELEPYNVRMGQPGCIPAHEIRWQLAHLGANVIVSMLPGAYYRPLEQAVREGNDRGSCDIDLMDAYESAPGIGWQRGVASSLVRTTGQLAAA